MSAEPGSVPPSAPETSSPLRSPVIARIAAHVGPATLGFGLAGLVALLSVLRHAPVLGTDGLLYHLPLAVWWLQHGWLSEVDLPFHGGGIEHGPALSQTLVMLLLRLTGDDGLVWLVQPACLVGLALALRRSARLLGASRSLAAGLAGAAALFPPFFRNAQLPNNDLLVTLGLAVALHGALLLRRRATRGLLLLGLGVGLALATKGTATISALAVAPFAGLGLVEAWRRTPAGPGRKKLVAYATTGAALLLLGSGFLLRNLVLHGNPMWPGVVRVAGVELFPGLYDYSAYIDHGWSAEAIGAVLVAGPEEHAIGPAWSVPLWLGWGLGFLVLAGPERGGAPGRRRGLARAALALGFAPLHFALVFALLPGGYEEPRYHLPTYCGLWLALALGLGRVARRPGLAPWTALVVPAWLAVQVGPAWLEPWVLVALAGAAASAALAARPRLRRPVLLAASGLAAVAVLAGPLWYPAYRAERRAARDDGWRWYAPRTREDQVTPDHAGAWRALDALGRDRPLVVAYAGTGLVYPLFGPTLSNRVVYARLSADDRPGPLVFPAPSHPPGIHEMPLRAAEARRARVDDAFWLAELDRLAPDVLLLVDQPLRGGCAQELALVARHPERFEELWRGQRARLLRVVK